MQISRFILIANANFICHVRTLRNSLEILNSWENIEWFERCILDRTCSYCIRYSRSNGNRIKQNEFTIYCKRQISLFSAKRNDLSTLLLCGTCHESKQRESKMLRVARMAEWAQRVNMKIFPNFSYVLSRFLRAGCHFKWYCSKVVKSKHTSTALMTFSHFVRKCSDFMVCVGPGNITLKNHISIFSFALIVITKQRGKQPSAKHVIEIFLKYLLRRSAFSAFAAQFACTILVRISADAVDGYFTRQMVNVIPVSFKILQLLGVGSRKLSNRRRLVRRFFRTKMDWKKMQSIWRLVKGKNVIRSWSLGTNP